MKAIILARVSSKEQEDNNSIPSQVRRMQEYVQKLGLELSDTYKLVESSTKGNRKKYNEIVIRIRKSKNRVALVTDTIDRLQRDFKESVVLDELRKERKVELHFMREGLVINDMSNSSELMRWDMGVMFAKGFVTQLSDNVKRGNEQKVKSGGWCGRAPIGYTNIDLDDGKKWIKPDPATAPKIIKVFEWYAGGSISMLNISNRLLEEFALKIPTSGVDRILKNPFYFGVMRIKGELQPHVYEPLISKDLFDVVQNRLGQFKKNPKKYAGLPYTYRGLIACAYCGCSITPEKSKGLTYYHCTQYKGKHGASYVREEALDEQFREAFTAIHPDEEQFNQVTASIKKARLDKNKYKAYQLSSLQAEIVKVESRLDRNHDAYIDGDIDKEYYHKKTTDYKLQKDDLYKKLGKLDEVNDDFYATIERIIGVARNAPLLLESSTLEQKQEIINLVLQNLELENDQLRWKYKKPFDLMASYKNQSSWLGRRFLNRTFSIQEDDPIVDVEEIRELLNEDIEEGGNSLTRRRTNPPYL